MRLWFWVIFFLSHVVHSVALEVVYEPYKQLPKNEIVVFDLTRDQDCYCFDENFELDISE